MTFAVERAWWLWLVKIVHWRVAPVWYAVALLGPPALAFGAVTLNLALGAPMTPNWELPGPGAWAVQFLFVLVWIGLGEELAWRGYALPRLLAGRTALAAACVVGRGRGVTSPRGTSTPPACPGRTAPSAHQQPVQLTPLRLTAISPPNQGHFADRACTSQSPQTLRSESKLCEGPVTHATCLMCRAL